MSKISTYEVVPVPKLSDKLIGTSVGGEIEDITYNFTLLDLLELYLPIIPANNLQGVLDYGNTASQDINLFGTITTTNLSVTETTNLFITYLNEETHVVGSLFDSADSEGTAGQVLTSTVDGVEWYTLPPIFTPNLQQVLTEGNTADIDILLDANIEALDVSADTATVSSNLTLYGTITDGAASVGAAGQVLSSSVTGVQWTDLPIYGATSPLLFDSITKVFSIQVANSTQDGYLTSNDWITFNGKQNAGPYITALTGEATASGPGSVPITLNNASVIAKVLTGLNVTGGSISASDSILTAFGKVQSQINGLMGGVQYQGTWDAATNNPVLTSSIGVQGHYYIVSVAGSTDLNGITDWKVGDWAIYSGGSWQKVDNTESVTSVNGQIGAVSLTTDDIPEGSTNLYYLNSRARAALSFSAGSGAYNNLTGVITIPTDNSQILNGAQYITLASISATTPLSYSNLTGVFSIQQASALQDGYLSAIDWATFNGKQNYLGGTGLVKSTSGTITYITDNSGNWNTAYDNMIVSAAVTGTSTKTLTLNQQDGGTIQASWTDLDTGLTSVGVSMPSAFSVANSPLTANGTIGITGAGTTLQYIDGTGALQTFPGLTGFVPYVGANQNLNMGTYGLITDFLQLNILPTSIPTEVGTMSWNDEYGTMNILLKGGNVTLQVGQENVTRVVNKTGIDLLQQNYQVVRVRKVAEGGAQGQRTAVVLAQGNNENNSTETLGLVTETILVNEEGFVTSFGLVNNIDTTGTLQAETWVDGDILYISDTVAGQLTKIRPIAPNHAVTVGYVTYAHANQGKITLAIDTGYELGELHNVYVPSPANNASIWWNSSNLRYENNTIAGILGYTPADAARQLTINGTTYDLTANRTWNVGTVTSVAALTLGTSGADLNSSVANGSTTPVITLNVPTASAANRGALSAADWSTFNTKVGGVTASSPLFSSGGQNPNITIQQASGSQDGYLSSVDWATFNNKQAAGNYITSLTGEATASGPGAAAVTLNNASVTGKVLTGVNITGGTVLATDTMLTAFGKLQNQINGLFGGAIYQGTWNANTNTPALASGIGTKGYYYIVSVAGTTNLDGITDWFIGDWAIFDGTAWQQVDNTDAVVSVNGQTGAVSLTTDNIPEGATNQYFTQARARASLSFAAGSGAYNSSTGLITIPTNTNQLTNGASFITLSSLSGVAPIQYNNGTGAISITQAGTSSNGFLSSTDWNTFNNKQPAGNYVPYTGANANVDLGVYFLKTSKVYKTYDWLQELNFGYSSSYKTLAIGSTTSANFFSLAFGVDLSGNPGGSFSGNGNEYFWRNSGSFKTPNAANTEYNTIFSWNSSGVTNFPNELTGGDAKFSGLIDARAFRIYESLSYRGGIYPYNLILGSGIDYGVTVFSESNLYFAATGSVNKLLTLNTTNATFTIPILGTSATFSGTITSTLGNNTNLFNSISATTGYQFMRIQNTEGSGYLGVEGSLINQLTTGDTAYSTVFGTLNATDLHLATDQTVRVTILRTTGNVGIGTNSPGTNKLHVYNGSSGGTAYNAGGLVVESSGRASIQLLAPNNQDSYLFFGDANSGTGGYIGHYGSSQSPADLMVYYSEGNHSFTSGNVGIGISTPANLLHLYGSDGNSYLRWTSNVATTGTRIGYNGTEFRIDQQENANLVLRTNGSTRLTIESGGAATFTSNVSALGGYFYGQTTNSFVRLDNTIGAQIGYSTYGSVFIDSAGVRISNANTTCITLNYSSYPTNVYDGGYKNLIAGGLSLMYRNNYDYYLGSNSQYNTAGTYMSIYGTEAGAGMLVFLGGWLRWLTYDGTAIAGTAQALTEKFGVTKNGAATFSNIVSVKNSDGISSVALAGSRFGYSSSYDGVRIGTTGAATLFFNVDVSANPSGSFSGNGSEYVWRNAGSFITPNSINNGYNTLFNWNSSGQLTVIGVFTVNGQIISTSASDILSATSSNTSYKWINLANSGGNLVVGINTSVGGATMSTSPYASYIFTRNATDLSFGTNEVRRLNIQAGGQVNVSSAVGGDWIFIVNNTSASGYGAYIRNSNDATPSIRIVSAATAALAFDFYGNGNMTAAGTISSSITADAIFTATVASTSRKYMLIQNTSGYVLMGVESSSGSSLATGGLPYAGIIGTSGSVNLQFYTNGIVRQTISPSGATTFTGDVNSSSGFQGRYARIFEASAQRGGLYPYNIISGGGTDYSVGVFSEGEIYLAPGGFATKRFTMLSTGATTFGSSVTATSFFESSDSRLKQLIEEDYRAVGIEKIKPKFYIKDGIEEVGYFAQEVQGILPCAISKSKEGFLNLSYNQVHTAKIAIIEDEVTVLKRRVAELESKLN